MLAPRDRIDLYSELVKEELIADDVAQSIGLYQRRLIRDGDFASLRYMMMRFQQDGDNVVADNVVAADNETVNAAFNVPLSITKTIYNDKQNVHSFTDDTLAIAAKLVRLYPSEYTGRPWDHSFFDKIESTRDCVYGDINVRDLFASTLKYINQSEHREDLMVRLREEMDESIDMCLSGHIVRLINTLRGFSSEFETTLDPYEYIKAKTFHSLNMKIDVFDTQNLIGQVESFVNDKSIELDRQYAIRILTDYTRCRWEYDSQLDMYKADY